MNTAAVPTFGDKSCSCHDDGQDIIHRYGFPPTYLAQRGRLRRNTRKKPEGKYAVEAIAANVRRLIQVGRCLDLK